MGSDREFAVRYLMAVEKKNQSYFAGNNLKIMDCVEIKGVALVSVHIIYPNLPGNIVEEIETMFWK